MSELGERVIGGKALSIDGLLPELLKPEFRKNIGLRIVYKTF
jgi:hypothetical protein